MEQDGWWHMSAHQPVEPGSNPGAPTLGGRGVGAGLPVPGATGSSPKLVRQLRRKLEKRCSRILAEMNSMVKYFDPDTVYKSFVYYAMFEYDELVFNDPHFNDTNVQSIMRVIDACNTDVLLLDFAPDVREVIADMKKDTRKKIARLAERLEKITLGRFLRSWESIMDTLTSSGYDDEAKLIMEFVDVKSKLMDTIETEIFNIAAKRGMSKEQAEQIIENIYTF